MTGLEKHQIFVELFQEIYEREPEVAYYVLLYYVNKGIELLGRNSTNQALKAEVLSKMDQLEALKRSLGDPVSKDTYEGFLTMLFCQIDTEDRQQGSGGPTAKKFRNCAKLIEAWGVIGPLSPAWEDKRKYCIWKAADIVKAIKERRAPRRGGPNEEQSSEPMDFQEPPPAPQVPSQSTSQPTFPQPTSQSAFPQAPLPPFPQGGYPQAPPVYPQSQPTAYPAQPGYSQPTGQPASTPMQPSQGMGTYPMANQQAFREGYGTKLTREQVRLLGQVIKASNNAVQEMEFKKIREAKEHLMQALQYLSSF